MREGVREGGSEGESERASEPAVLSVTILETHKDIVR